MKTRSRALMLALGLAIGLLPLIFLLAYFLIFNDLKTPPNSMDGQAGLAEFLRLIYSLGATATCVVLGFFITLRRFWPRTKI